MPLFAGGWGAALSGAIKGMANQRLKDIELEEQFERQKQLLLYKQELEYRQQLRFQEELQRKAEHELKMQQEEKAQKERLALIENNRIEEGEIEQITALFEKADSNGSNNAENLISKSIPKWKEIVESEEFSSWFYQQSDQDQRLADSSSHLDAIKLIKLYKNKK